MKSLIIIWAVLMATIFGAWAQQNTQIGKCIAYIPRQVYEAYSHPYEIDHPQLPDEVLLLSVGANYSYALGSYGMICGDGVAATQNYEFNFYGRVCGKFRPLSFKRCATRKL